MKVHDRRSSAQPPGRRISGHAQEPPTRDPYEPAGKLSSPTLCPRCGAVFSDGRWRWAPEPALAEETICPACRRIRDDHPAGIATLTGDAVKENREEILRLVRHEEQAETGEHPLNRIMGIVDRADSLTIRTTDIHLPGRIGKALQRAYDGQLEIRFDDSAYFVDVTWQSE